METETNVAPATDDAALFEKIANGRTAEQQPSPEPQLEKAPEAEKPQPPSETTPQAVHDKERNFQAMAHDERRQRQALERQLSELTAAMRANQPPPPPPPAAPEWFEDPKGFVQHEFSPFMNEQRQREVYNGRLIAEARFGEDKVRDAEKAFNDLVASGQIHPADYAKVQNSPNPFAESVKWHNTHRIVSEIGTDPNAYRQKLRTELLTDPDFRKEAMSAWQAQATQQPSRQAAPPINIPSLSRVGAAAIPSNESEALSDSELFEKISRGRRRA